MKYKVILLSGDFSRSSGMEVAASSAVWMTRAWGEKRNDSRNLRLETHHFRKSYEKSHGDERFMVYNSPALFAARAESDGFQKHLLINTGVATNVTKNQKDSVVQRFFPFRPEGSSAADHGR